MILHLTTIEITDLNQKKTLKQKHIFRHISNRLNNLVRRMAHAHPGPFYANLEL